MNGTRNDAVVNQDIDLYFQFTFNYRPFDAFLISRVVIYPTMDDAIANTNPIETITTENITRVDIGLYKYVTKESIPEAYFDKIYIIPKDGMSEVSFINTFYVRPEVIGGGSGDQPKSVLVYGFADFNTTPANKYQVRVKLDKSRVYNDTVTILEKRMTVQTNQGGYWEIPLVVTDMMDDGANYIFNINGLEYRKTVPQTSGPVCNIYSLPDFTE